MGTTARLRDCALCSRRLALRLYWPHAEGFQKPASTKAGQSQLAICSWPVALEIDDGTVDRDREGSSHVDQSSTVGVAARNFENAVTVLSRRIEEEFRIAERHDAKARQALAIAAGFFAATQVTTVASLNRSSVHAGARVAIVAAALVAGLALVVVARRLISAEELRKEDDIDPDRILAWCEEGGEKPEYVSGRLVRELTEVAKARAHSNRGRAERYSAVATATRSALVLTGIELMIALAVRV
jgi:hypothetical protein